jgi:hypothetical protein
LQLDSLLHPRKDVVDPLERPQPTAIVVDNVDRGEHLRSTESTGGPAARVGEGAVLGVSVQLDTITRSSIVDACVLSIVDDPIWEQTPE